MIVRAGLVILGLLHLTWGIPAVVAPRWFFDTFPWVGPGWTAAYPPFNVHLMTDVGAAFTTLGVLLLVAAALGDRRVTAVVLLGLIVFSTIHLVFHLGNHGELSGVELPASLATLAAGVAAPVFLLVLSRRQPA